MGEHAGSLAKAETDLLRAQRLLAFSTNLNGDEWMLIATLVGEADLLVREVLRTKPGADFPLLHDVVAEFREATANFTDRDFLRSTRAARRRNKALFCG